MTILTHQSSGTNMAQIRSSLEKGFRKIYITTCTESEGRAAKNVVLKYFGYPASQTVREVTDATEIKSLVGDFFKDPKRKQVFGIWTFNPQAR